LLQGLVITRVNPSSPAAAAGLLPDDVVVSCDGERQVTLATLADRFKQSIGGGVELGIVRQSTDGSYQQMKVKVHPVEATSP
jgi:C-terminal processing protease CtpA/Prc